MFFSILLWLGLGCSETGLSSVEKGEESSWFDETSALYRDDFDPEIDADPVDEDDPDEDDTPSPDGDEDDDGDADIPEEDEPDSDLDSDSDADNDSEPDGDPDGDPDGEPDGDPDEDSDADFDDEEDADPDGYTGPDDEDDESSSSTGSGGHTPRAPLPGEVVITELMINPVATDDVTGEWVEVQNVSSYWLDLSGAVLSDRGVDGVEIVAAYTGSMMVAPGGLFTICAEADYWENGGVDCDSTFHYWTLGGGFALSNTEDEVILASSTGAVLDEFSYSEGFALEGESMGLRTDRTSPIANDFASNWCEQISFLPFGDGGTPREINDSCW